MINDGAWQDIGTVTATGSPTQNATYSMVDKDPGMGTNFYRLRLVNEDGSIEYSNQVEVVFGSGEFVTVSPNPGAGQFDFDINLIEESQIAVEVFNTEGKRIFSMPPSAMEAGKSQVHTDISNQPAGTYFYFILGAKETHSGKLVIEK